MKWIAGIAAAGILGLVGLTLFLIIYDEYSTHAKFYD